MADTRLLIGFTGWMDGGEVSTGTVDWLIRKLEAQAVAEIPAETFNLFSFPGNMELSAMFRPHVKIEQGLITRFTPPASRFWANAEHRLLLLQGREPQLDWVGFAEAVFEAVRQFDVRTIYFVGSVAGVVPHTRDPRFFCSVSHAAMRDEMARFGVRASGYEGPGSFVTFLTVQATRMNLPLATLVAEIPPYVEGHNPRCIEATLRRLAAILNLPLGLDDLRTTSDAFEQRVNESVEDRPEVREMIARMESDYDNDLLNTEMGDFKSWLQQRGIELD
ncbi:MAG: hypothetical protein BIFFINMI_01306 [Phycisphaerae bacterium]|nr:hypothetical protein [Phycisphaerae bacterium]